jgi:hypothetical protein
MPARFAEENPSARRIAVSISFTFLYQADTSEALEGIRTSGDKVVSKSSLHLDLASEFSPCLIKRNDVFDSSA